MIFVVWGAADTEVARASTRSTRQQQRLLEPEPETPTKQAPVSPPRRRRRATAAKAALADISNADGVLQSIQSNKGSASVSAHRRGGRAIATKSALADISNADGGLRSIQLATGCTFDRLYSQYVTVSPADRVSDCPMCKSVDPFRTLLINNQQIIDLR